jgi:uncharacterized protein YqeY
MNILEQLNSDMKDAMRAKEAGKLQLSVIRMIKSAAKYQEIEKGEVLTEADIINVISKELKQRRDVLPEYEKNQRTDMVTTLQQEIDVLMKYLPKQLSDQEIQELIAQAIKTVNPAGPKDMGKIMGLLNPQIKGKADGRKVSELVKAALAGIDN